MTKKSDLFEVEVANFAKIAAPTLTITHTGGNVHLSDISIGNDTTKTYIEVKMSGAQFGTPRLKYESSSWSGIECNYITDNISKMLNESNHVSNLIDMMVYEHEATYSPTGSPWIGYKKTHYRDRREYLSGDVVNTDNIENMLDYYTIQHVLKNINGNQTILWNTDSDNLNDIVTNYYIDKGANYIQVGDNFFALNHNISDSLGIKDDTPNMIGDVNLTVRFSFRKTDKWIEIIPTIKYNNIKESPYSLKPNTKKDLPFKE